MNGNNNIKLRLIILSWLQFAIWGSYLTSMGRYLTEIGLGDNIGWFYSVQGIVSIFMPALIGIVADRWIQAQKLLSICHGMSALLMGYLGYVGFNLNEAIQFSDLFPVYAIAVAFYMPTIALTYSVSYSALKKFNLDTIKSFPPIRLFGTVGFIVSMWIVDIFGFQQTPAQFYVCAVWGILMSVYSLTMPKCPTGSCSDNKSLASSLGLDAFKLFKVPHMAVFFIFSMFLGVSLQITNGYANPFISSFENIEEYKGLFFVEHANILISLSQVSETLCILLIPFFLKRYGIKTVMLIAMFAWVLRFALFDLGTPTWPGILCLIMSMVVYGVAFDFFNISGSLFVDNETDSNIRSSAQGLFMMMTNGFGAAIGTLSAQTIVNKFVFSQTSAEAIHHGWETCWLIFSAYALLVGLLFSILFKVPKKL